MAQYTATVNLPGAGTTATVQADNPRSMHAKVLALYKNDRGVWGNPGECMSYMELPCLNAMAYMDVGATIGGRYMVCGPQPHYVWDSMATLQVTRTA